jgi:hypothetical protein
MSRLPLTGSLPDSIPEDSSLTVWYAINKDPITGRPAGPGFSGPLPRSLERAGSLAFLEMSGHQLTGGVPTLPAKIRMFEAHNNKLNGGIACESLAWSGGGGVSHAWLAAVHRVLALTFCLPAFLLPPAAHPHSPAA